MQLDFNLTKIFVTKIKWYVLEKNMLLKNKQFISSVSFRETLLMMLWKKIEEMHNI